MREPLEHLGHPDVFEPVGENGVDRGEVVHDCGGDAGEVDCADVTMLAKPGKEAVHVCRKPLELVAGWTGGDRVHERASIRKAASLATASSAS